MFARVQTFYGPSEKLDELMTLTHDQLSAGPAPVGFEGFRYLVDRDNGKALLISFWETKEDLRHLEETNVATRARVGTEAGIEPPEAEVFEVALHLPATDSSGLH